MLLGSPLGRVVLFGVKSLLYLVVAAQSPAHHPFADDGLRDERAMHLGFRLVFLTPIIFEGFPILDPFVRQDDSLFHFGRHSTVRDRIGVGAAMRLRILTSGVFSFGSFGTR